MKTAYNFNSFLILTQLPVFLHLIFWLIRFLQKIQKTIILKFQMKYICGQNYNKFANFLGIENAYLM